MTFNMARNLYSEYVFRGSHGLPKGNYVITCGAKQPYESYLKSRTKTATALRPYEQVQVLTLQQLRVFLNSKINEMAARLKTKKIRKNKKKIFQSLYILSTKLTVGT